jgi:RimJ/RimL family protein N-acetyltransferase
MEKTYRKKLHKASVGALMSAYPKEYEKTITFDDRTTVLFRPELAADTEMLWEMFSTLSEESLRFLVLPFPREQIEQWTSNINYEKALPILAVVQHRKKTRIVASASLEFSDADAYKHKAEFGITVHDDFQNRGMGIALTKYMLDIAKKKKLHKVFLKVMTKNKRATHVYEKCGFKIEAKLAKENFVDGKYYDDYIMSVFL